MKATATSTSAPPLAPGGAPLLGHVVPLLRHPLAFMDSLRRHGPVVRIMLGRIPVFVVTDAGLTHEMLTAQASSFGKGGRLIEALSRFAGNGLATVADGDLHRTQRRLVQPMFSRAFIAGRGDTMIEVARSVVDGWAAGEPRELHDDMQELTLSVFLAALLGTEPPEATRRRIQRVLPDVMAGTIRATILPPWLGSVPTPTQRRQRDSFTELRDAIGDLVDEHRRPLRDKGLLDLLLDARDPDTGQPMSRRQLEDEVITFVTTNGQASTATVLWALHEIGRHPAVRDRIVAELDEVAPGRPLVGADLGSLTYTRRVVHEAMRLYGPAWLLTRTVTAPASLGGFDLPQGATVVFSPYILHRDPVVYPDPAAFDPDRWSPERARSIPRTAFQPFGGGARQCVGESFAWSEMVIILAETTRRWRMVPDPAVVPRPVPRVTIHPHRLVMTPSGTGR
ncbi:cytochrome P450 [Umezawaea tangerina]|uniref:Cytochrome P450 n=1 Tax=Umezawaea tangerina TaxID=84725 RepID=A0A2T0T2C8_9PSEU|nr:cytochrome P450 [Umezawaea tangerina]PRY39812.1 cytochrome P450 [Umezawaea tangerina]